MKYTIRQYAEALNSALKKKEAAERRKIVGRFLNVFDIGFFIFYLRHACILTPVRPIVNY